MITTTLYDDAHRYVIDHRDDPAWPGMTPEPYQDAVVLGLSVPAARSWVANAQPAHHALVAKMLLTLPGRRLTRIVGHGDQSDSWMACNDGPDGHGSWLIPYDPDRAARAVDGRKRCPLCGHGDVTTITYDERRQDLHVEHTDDLSCSRSPVDEQGRWL